MKNKKIVPVALFLMICIFVMVSKLFSSTADTDGDSKESIETKGLKYVPNGIVESDFNEADTPREETGYYLPDELSKQLYESNEGGDLLKYTPDTNPKDNGIQGIETETEGFYIPNE